jgi:hypothetical protein
MDIVAGRLERGPSIQDVAGANTTAGYPVMMTA